jgi:hypothetical protein
MCGERWNAALLSRSDPHLPATERWDLTSFSFLLTALVPDQCDQDSPLIEITEFLRGVEVRIAIALLASSTPERVTVRSSRPGVLSSSVR